MIGPWLVAPRPSLPSLVHRAPSSRSIHPLARVTRRAAAVWTQHRPGKQLGDTIVALTRVIHLADAALFPIERAKGDRKGHLGYVKKTFWKEALPLLAGRVGVGVSNGCTMLRVRIARVVAGHRIGFLPRWCNAPAGHCHCCTT